MDKKLTLSLDEHVIEQAKIYAKENDTSLSRMVESFLLAVIQKKTEPIEITPLVKSLIGVVELPADFNEKEEYGKYIIEKYK